MLACSTALYLAKKTIIEAKLSRYPEYPDENGVLLDGADTRRDVIVMIEWKTREVIAALKMVLVTSIVSDTIAYLLKSGTRL